jgi:hypothetical protein
VYSTNNMSPQRDGMPAATTPTVTMRRRSRARWIASVCVGIALCSLTLCASADTDIYLYDGNGTPVNVTQSYSYQEHYVYDLLGSPIGSVDAHGRIFNASSQQIGYILSTPEG